jgi:hypothetical protein
MTMRFQKILLILIVGFNLMATASFLEVPKVIAQSNFDIPTLLPSENANIGGGKRGQCIGMADMIRTGNIHLYNISCFLLYFTQMLVGLAGSIAVIMVMYGGYRYLISGENQEEAKKTITYALIGLVVTLSAWIIVDLVLQAATE